MRLVLFAPLFFLSFTSCTTSEITPLQKNGNFALYEDEKRLWDMSKEERTRLDKSGHLYMDSNLTGYLNEVAKGLLPEDIRRQVPFEIKIIKNPLFNAFAFPHGAIYIHTGLLAKMENEAQLATVIAHEVSHVTHRHALQQLRVYKGATAAVTTIQVIGAPAGLPGAGALILGGLGAMAAISGYSKALEREADEKGLELMVKAGYDPKEATKLFKHMQKFAEEEKINEPFFFGSHPRLQERRDSYLQLIESKYKDQTGFNREKKFLQKTSSLIIENVILDLAMGRFNRCQEALEKFLEREPDNARAHFYLGETFRQRSEEGDKPKAEQEYQRAIRHDPSYPDPHKGLGLIFYKERDLEKAQNHFEKYLALTPKAKDKAYIKQYLKTRKEDSGAP